jgi:hypothetical protein
MHSLFVVYFRNDRRNSPERRRRVDEAPAKPMNKTVI